MHQDYHYSLRVKFNESIYDEILLFLDSEDINSFEEGQSVANDQGEYEFINEYSQITLRFENIESLEVVKSKLKASFSKIEIKDLGKQKNYLNEWKKFAKAIEINQKITILPTWLAKENDYQDSSKIILDAGYAFGSGSHETTILCAREIERLSPVNSMLDVGCGSGILSMIASRNKCKKIKAIDVDSQAVETAKLNAKSNFIRDIDSKIEFSTESLAEIKESYDLVVANILSRVLLELRQDLIRVLKPGAKLVLSGILALSLIHI